MMVNLPLFSGLFLTYVLPGAGMMVDIVCPVAMTADSRDTYAVVHFARPYGPKQSPPT